MDSNHRRHRQQIYSLPHLATLVTTHCLKGGAKVLFIFHSRKSCANFLPREYEHKIRGDVPSLAFHQ